MSNSTTKIAKPRPDFPLFPHATGRWAKKVRGNLCYFGKTADDPKGEQAIELWLDQKDDLLAGRKPRSKQQEGLTVKELVNRFMAVREALVKDGELSPRTFFGYRPMCEKILRVFGKNRLVTDLRPEDFEALRVATFSGLGIEARSHIVRCVRAVFNFAYKHDLIDKPIRYGEAFKPPTAKVRQKDRGAKKESRKLTPQQIRSLIENANVHYKAMFLLGINCGFGNHDIATLKLCDLDLEAGWHNHARPKTSVPRRCKLWPETIAAIRASLASRPTPKHKENEDLVFITLRGFPYVRWAPQADEAKNGWRDAITITSRALFRKLGINGGSSFYSLRRMTETCGGNDQVAIDVVMGHISPGMGTTYRLDIDDSRLEAVADHIHAWLFPSKAKKGGKQ